MASRNKTVSGTERKISLSEPLELGNGEWERSKGGWEQGCPAWLPVEERD